MTREEILNMPAGKEMDALVAEKLMGWHAVTENGFNHWVDADGRFQHGVAPYDGFEDDEDFHTLNWHPSESILWVWEVETKIFEDGNTVMYINELIEMVLRDEGLPIHNDWLHWFLVAHAEPVQRCRAALLATLEKV